MLYPSRSSAMIDATATKPPSLVLGRYELLGRIAEGGMGDVYLARARGLGGFERRFIVKRLAGDAGVGPAQVAMFVDEARLVAALDHPNIVQVIDFGQDGDSLCLVMEYLHGRDARWLLRRCAALAKPIPIEVAVHVAKCVCAALHHAHEQRDRRGEPLGIVHRDVSPHNVLLTFEGEVKLIDFGIAKSADRLIDTETDVIKGKLGYMAPEQCRRLAVDRRADVFAVGILLFELSTMRRLFGGDDPLEVMQDIADRPRPSPRSVGPGYPEALERVVLRALERDPAARYATAAELARALDDAVPPPAGRAMAERLAALMHESFASELSAWQAARGEPPREVDALTSWHRDPELASARASVASAGESSQATASAQHAARRRPEGARRALAALAAGAAVVAASWALRAARAPAAHLAVPPRSSATAAPAVAAPAAAAPAVAAPPRARVAADPAAAAAPADVRPSPAAPARRPAAPMTRPARRPVAVSAPAVSAPASPAPASPAPASPAPASPTAIDAAPAADSPEPRPPRVVRPLDPDDVM